MSAERRAKIMEQAGAALVQVELFMKHPVDDDGDGPGGLGETVSAQSLDRQQENVIRFKMAVHMMGVVVAPREVLVPDTGIDPRRIALWEVIDSTGRRQPARKTAFLRDAPALVLEPTDADAKWAVPNFEDAALTPATAITLVVPRWSMADLRWSLSIATTAAATDWRAGPTAGGAAAEAADRPYWVVNSLAARAAQSDSTPSSNEPPPAAFNLIFSPGGDLIGAGLTDRIHADRRTSPWRGDDLRTTPRIAEDSWERIRNRVRRELTPVVYPVRIEFRRPKALPITIPEVDRLGWAVTDRIVLVPGGLPRQFAAWIGKIFIQTRGSEIESEFVGQIKGFDAILLKLPDSAEPLPAHSDLSRVGKIERYRPHVAVTINRKYGANDLRVEYTRVLGTEYGYADRISPRLTPAPSIGSLVLDFEGNPIGLFARQRRPHEELEAVELNAAGGQAQISSSVELFGVEDVANAVNDPARAIDRRIVRREEKDQDRRVWLGVESNPLTRELAESFGCRKESRDGTIGLIVSQVYSGSPAERIGLRPNDVLMWLDVPERDRPVRFTAGRGLGGRGRPDLSQLRGGDFAGQGPRAPWPAQANYLNNLLGTLGENAEVTLSFWRDGKMHETRVVVAQAPPDQDSAEQFKDESVGITVKELTYEVRAALQLKPNDPGVVVSKVESGSSAGRARIEPFEIIQAADGELVDSPGKLESIVKKAQREKKEQIRLTVVNRGRSRFADLKLAQ